MEWRGLVRGELILWASFGGTLLGTVKRERDCGG